MARRQNSKNYVIMVGFRCNNNCLMCSVDYFRNNFRDLTTGEIFKELRKGRDLGFKSVEFTGGEPTVRPDFLALINKAKGMGFKKITVGSNGRLFSYRKFCRGSARRGLAGAMISLHSSTAKLHDTIVRTVGAFEQSVQGIKNIVKELPAKDVYLLSVVSRLNIRDLEGLARLIRPLGIKKWNLLNLVPEGAAETRYKSLFVSLADISTEINRNFQAFYSFASTAFFDFPLCVFPLIFWKNKRRFQFITTKERRDNINQVGYGFEPLIKIHSRYVDARRRHLPACQRCRWQNECGGVWNEYVKIRGEEKTNGEVADLAGRNNCF